MTTRFVLPKLREALKKHTKLELRIAFFGDSISQISDKWFGGASCPENNWGPLLCRLLKEKYPNLSLAPRHFGIGGQNTYEGLGRIHELGPFRPDIVFTAFGANDCAYHFLIPEETFLALANMVHEIRSRLGADVIVVGTAGDNPLKPFFKHLEETLAAQHKAAQQRGAPFVDVRKAILQATENGRKWSEYHLDERNCHPNDNGHAVWAQAALQTIKSSLEQAIS